MLIEYRRYLDKLRNSFSRCGIGIDGEFDYSYESIFELTEILSEMLYFFSAMKIGGSPQGTENFMYSLDDYFMSGVRDKYFEEYLLYKKGYLSMSSSYYEKEKKLSESRKKKDSEVIDQSLSTPNAEGVNGSEKVLTEIPNLLRRNPIREDTEEDGIDEEFVNYGEPEDLEEKWCSDDANEEGVEDDDFLDYSGGDTLDEDLDESWGSGDSNVQEDYLDGDEFKDWGIDDEEIADNDEETQEDDDEFVDNGEDSLEEEDYSSDLDDWNTDEESESEDYFNEKGESEGIGLSDDLDEDLDEDWGSNDESEDDYLDDLDEEWGSDEEKGDYSDDLDEDWDSDEEKDDSYSDDLDEDWGSSSGMDDDYSDDLDEDWGSSDESENDYSDDLDEEWGSGDDENSEDDDYSDDLDEDWGSSDEEDLDEGWGTGSQGNSNLSSKNGSKNLEHTASSSDTNSISKSDETNSISDELKGFQDAEKTMKIMEDIVDNVFCIGRDLSKKVKNRMRNSETYEE